MRDKSLTANLSSPIYQYDNNADQIKCLLPCIYDGICLKDATVTLVYKDESGNGGFIELVNSDELFNKDYYQFTNKINSKFTNHSGKLIFWLRINNYDTDYSFETGETSITILPSKEIPKVNVQSQSSYFNQWFMKMKQTENRALQVLRDATNQANLAREEAEKARIYYEKMSGGDKVVN